MGRAKTRAVIFVSGVLGALLTPTYAFAANGSEPARGAQMGDILWGTGAATAATAFVIWTAMAHRAGRISWLGRLAGFAERVSGLPGWAALPSAITGGSLLVAVFGFYWDVAKHIDTGRDPSPFGTPAHYPILVGLFGIAVGGFVAIVLGADKNVRTAIRISEGWYAPLGGVLIFMCGGFALTGFPLDDVWHTLFGQDVTLWGPTHVLMVGGASLATLGVWVLLVEARGATASGTVPNLFVKLRAAMAGGAFLLGLSALQGEFDYGVPQFQLVFQPILLMIAASVGLVAARVKIGRLGALQAVAFYLVVRALLTLIVGSVFGLSTLHFPLYIAEALIVELVAWRIPREKPLTLGAVAGVLIGTVGLAAEWGWSHVWMPLPWPSALLPEAAVMGFIAALAGGVLGGFVGRALTAGSLPRQAAPRWLLPAAALVLLFCIAFPMPMNSGSRASASVSLTDVTPAPHRTVAATIRLSPRSAASKSDWLTVTSWQGGGLVVDRLHKISEGVYRTTKPIPAYGNWKTMLRLENGRGVRATPIYLPLDKAIPAPEVPAKPAFTRDFVRDKKILQREAVGGTTWLQLPAYLLLALIVVVWLAAMGLGLRRLELAADARTDKPLPHLPRRFRHATKRIVTPA
ncbi:MAG TPA: hypothetical protein VN606_07970 [Thermoleophilaceae bacterium]|nr:hypothetical protein [Thermoleophilaceae bacterium]